VNPVWLARNLGNAWRRKASLADFGRRILWIYGSRLGKILLDKEIVISFRYPYPVGRISLLLRTNSGADAFIHGEVFEHEYYRLPLRRSPATILDLGANIGLSAVYFSRLYPDAQMACVEPVPANLRLLKRNLELNDIQASIFPAAVHSQDGDLEVELDAMDYGHRVVIGLKNSSKPSLNVAAMTVPTICRQLGWKRIGLLKVDIEGHEKQLFAGDCDWLARVDAMCIEWHDELGKGRLELERLANRFGFGQPQLLPGIWLLSREL
jgi:FkbM family methyltransferase